MTTELRIPCVGGPLDGEEVSPERGLMFRPMGGSGTYIRRGDVYKWLPNT